MKSFRTVLLCTLLATLGWLPASAVTITSGFVSAGYSFTESPGPKSMAGDNFLLSLFGGATAGPAALCNPPFASNVTTSCQFLLTASMGFGHFPSAPGSLVYNGTTYTLGASSGNDLILDWNFVTPPTTVTGPCCSLSVENVPFTGTGRVRIVQGSTTVLDLPLEGIGLARGLVDNFGGSRTWAFATPEPSAWCLALTGLAGLALRVRRSRRGA